MVVTLILILLIVVFMAFFIGMNLSNVCTFWFFKTFENLPVAVLTLIAFGAGIIFALLFIFIAKMKAPPSDAEERALRKLEKKMAKEAKKKQPDMKKTISTVLVLLVCTSAFAADLTASFVTSEAAKKDSVEESVSYLKSQISKMNVAAEKRATYIFLASLQEQMALYDDAQKSYAQAAAIAAGNAEGMPKKTNEQIVLDAVRCALSSGDYATADSYLNSAVRNSKNADVQAYIKLYTQWSALCKADDVSGIQEPVVMLQAYLKVDSMNAVKPAVLLTLWYVTGDGAYSKEITKLYPKSIEASIVRGDVQLLPTPFWFFVPKSGEAEQGTGSFTMPEEPKAVASQTTSAAEKPVKFTKWQLGLFRTENNAKLLADEVKAKGFDSYITTETRASGTTYYIVLVREDKSGNVADRLRSSGYDCYGVE